MNTAAIVRNQSISSDQEGSERSTSEASFWDESQIQAVIRHAGATGRSPEEFFNRKWKKVLCKKGRAS